jgi:molybdopterin synthase sulfur carrier subunit
VRVLYFAWLRQHVGFSEEAVVPPADVRTVGQLISWLSGRGEGYARALADPAQIRAAVNQVHVPFSAEIASDDEIALFPPVTGG